METSKGIKESFDKYITLETQLKDLEKQIYDLETFYLDETQHSGNLLRGWEHYIIGKQANSQPIFHHLRKPKVQPNEMAFSLSSITNPVHQVMEEIFNRNKDNCYGIHSFQATASSVKRKKQIVRQNRTTTIQRDSSGQYIRPTYFNQENYLKNDEYNNCQEQQQVVQTEKIQLTKKIKKKKKNLN